MHRIPRRQAKIQRLRRRQPNILHRHPHHRRAQYIGSSPASSIRPSQYSAASGSELRTLLCSAEMMS